MILVPSTPPTPPHGTRQLARATTTPNSFHTMSDTTPNMIDEMPDRRTTSRIRWCSRNSRPYEALALFRELARDNPNHTGPALAAVLRCCSALGDVNTGREVHAFMTRNDAAATCRSETALVSFYAKCGFLSKAREVFDGMAEKDVTAWTVMLMAYADSENCKDGEMMSLLLEMLRTGVAPNTHTLTVVLRCVTPELGTQLQARVVKSGWATDAFVGSSLIDFYARSGNCGCAHVVFDRIEDKDVVCYNSLISGYGRNGNVEGLLSLFSEMCLAGLAPNQPTLVGLLNGCANAGVLGLSKQIHAHAVVRGFLSEVIVQGVVVDMYAKCGNLSAARTAFDRMSGIKGVVSWNSMICGYAKHGRAEEALLAFHSMKLASVHPDRITFTCLLSACSHSGLIDEGWRLFDSMDKVYGISPTDEHYCCIVDLLGRAGMVHEAYEFICTCDYEFGASVWGALLSASRVSGEAEIGEFAARKLFEMEPKCSGSYIALASTFAANKRWGDANLIRKLMDSRRIRKDPGYSWIEIGGVVYKFRAGEGMDHPFIEEVRDLCGRLNSCMHHHPCLQMQLGSDDY